ncbi:MAG: DUF2269 family protein [Anaerolineae bacterium]|nr:DUF2269 family protein [Anaerolineae bacterium]
MALIVKFLHIATAVWFISGLLGRTLTMWQASKSPDVRMVVTLVRLAGYFERWLVIPGSLAVLGFGLVTAWIQQWPVLGSLQGSSINWLLMSTLLYLSMIPIIVLIFVPRGKVFGQALAQAAAQGIVTANLNAAFQDRMVRIAHAYELAATGVITFLMVSKPF